MFAIWFLILAALATPTWGTRIKITALECNVVDATFCAIENCALKPIGRDLKDASVKIKLLQIPVTNVTIRAEIWRRGNFHLPLYTFNVNGCRFMESENRNPIANAIYKFLRLSSHSNINHSCPYDHDVILDHMRVDESFNLPLPLAPGEFTINSLWMAYNVPRATVNLKFYAA